MTSCELPLLRGNTWWIRETRNPVLGPAEAGDVDSTCCMNPYVLRQGGVLRLYYAGGDDDGRRRICLATASPDDPVSWERHGPLLDVGARGDFDEFWCVLPHVVQIAPDRWHLYYTGRRRQGSGLGSFAGIGLAVSDDGDRWRRHDGNPVLARTGITGDPDAVGIAGGSVLRAALPGGSSEWRFYYTGCPTLGDDLFLDQQKCVCLATSQDGIQWERHGAVMHRDATRDYENVAVAGPVVHQNADGGFRMWFSAIGTRWGAYSIGYAESDDGIVWRRGPHYGDDLQLGPAGKGWEREMVEYPSVLQEASRQRLFYCGNGYGATGIGTAVSSPLRATAAKGPCLVHLVAAQAKGRWQYRIPEGLSCDEGVFKVHTHPVVDWDGPDANGTIWHEWQTNEEDSAVIRSYDRAEEFGLTFVEGLHYRVMIRPEEYGLSLRFTATNLSEATFHNVVAFPCLGFPSDDFRDDRLGRTFILTDAGLTRVADTDRGTGDLRRTHYHIQGRPPLRYFGEPFWGAASKTIAVGGAIVRTRADGRFTVGTSWENVCEIFQNEDEHHHCMHSLPTLGDLDAGETRTVRGRIVLVEGGPQDALHWLRNP